jgi:hypothetical protein
MEDVLEVYHRPRDPEVPVICLDEASKQLITETRVPVPAKPGHLARHDYEYERNGTANLFMMFAPLEGWRHVEVTDPRVAARGLHRPGLRPDPQGPVRQALSRQQKDRAHSGQSQHPQTSVTLRGIPRTGGTPIGGAVRVALHSQARQLAPSG